MIELCNVSIRSGPFVLSDVNFSVPAGGYGVLMGGTGQGKTTIAEAICGLRTVERGSVVGGVNVTRFKPADRGIGYVPQDLALFPTMTVREHLEFALRIRRAAPTLIRDRVEELSHVLGIEAMLARNEPIVVPVFGRGRAMTAVKAESLDEALLAECSGFLCGACSCQVKQSNPGFDLLLAVNWDERLWGESDIRPPTTETHPLADAGDQPGEPQYVPIPAGRKEAPASERQRSAALPAEGQPGRTIYWAALGVAALVVGIVLGCRRTSSANRQ